MMHAFAFSQSQDAGGVLSFMAGVPDPTTRVQGNDIVVPQTMKKLFGSIACLGATATRGQFISPSLRRIQPYDIQPFSLGLIPTGGEPLMLHPQSLVELDYNEMLNCQIVSDPAAAEQATVVALLTDSALAPVNGKIVKCRFTVTMTLVAGVWVSGVITFVNNLPIGVYSVVGAQIVAPAGVAARFFPVGQAWRPGFPCSQTFNDRQDPLFRNGGLGKWFDFDQTQPPTIDIISSAAAGSTTYNGVMDLIPA